MFSACYFKEERVFPVITLTVAAISASTLLPESISSSSGFVAPVSSCILVALLSTFSSSQLTPTDLQRVAEAVAMIIRSVAPIIGSVIGNTLYWLGFMNIGSVHLSNC